MEISVILGWRHIIGVKIRWRLGEIYFVWIVKHFFFMVIEIIMPAEITTTIATKIVKVIVPLGTKSPCNVIGLVVKPIVPMIELVGGRRKLKITPGHIRGHSWGQPRGQSCVCYVK